MRQRTLKCARSGASSGLCRAHRWACAATTHARAAAMPHLAPLRVLHDGRSVDADTRDRERVHGAIVAGRVVDGVQTHGRRGRRCPAQWRQTGRQSPWSCAKTALRAPLVAPGHRRHTSSTRPACVSKSPAYVGRPPCQPASHRGRRRPATGAGCPRSRRAARSPRQCAGSAKPPRRRRPPPATLGVPRAGCGATCPGGGILHAHAAGVKGCTIQEQQEAGAELALRRRRAAGDAAHDREEPRQDPRDDPRRPRPGTAPARSWKLLAAAGEAERPPGPRRCSPAAAPAPAARAKRARRPRPRSRGAPRVRQRLVRVRAWWGAQTTHSRSEAAAHACSCSCSCCSGSCSGCRPTRASACVRVAGWARTALIGGPLRF